jgi:hypothetical protein
MLLALTLDFIGFPSKGPLKRPEIKGINTVNPVFSTLKVNNTL